MKEIVLTPDNLNLYDILDYHSCSSSLPNDEKLPIPLKTIELMKLKYSITDVVFTK